MVRSLVVFYKPVRNKAIIPLKNTQLKVPAPLILATGAHSLGLFRIFSKSYSAFSKDKSEKVGLFRFRKQKIILRILEIFNMIFWVQ